MKYEVIITEILQKRVIVESDCPINAETSVRKKYFDEDIVLGDGDFQTVEFKVREYGNENRKD